jgi:hypothetical protein
MSAGDLIDERQARRAIGNSALARDALVAPGFTADLPQRWSGRLAKKPWDYLVTALIPHIGRTGPLPEVIELLRLQTERPYLMVVDTGSPRDCHDELETLRTADVEIHYIRGHGYQHPSAPVCAALDLGFALCRTPFLFLTHNDVFPRRRDLLERFIEQCGPACPVVGYEMSPREGTGWRGVVSHTATMVHMPTMRKLGPTWSLESYWDNLGYRPRQKNGWPDTEQPFDLCLKRAGIRPKLIGAEKNYLRHLDHNIDHARSHTGLRMYPVAGLREKSERVMARALAEARERIREWRTR